MVRMIPSTGKIIMPTATASLEETLAKGVWTPVWRTAVLDSAAHNTHTIDEHSKDSSDWQAELISEDGGQFAVSFAADITDEEATGVVDWSMSGIHNVNNALVAVAAAYNIGISVKTACAALSAFAGIKRRMELIGDVNDILVFDDFAHHPTAITTTLDGAKKKLANRRIWAIIEPRSNTMKMGIHQDSLAESAALADHTLWYEPTGLEWGLKEVIENANSVNPHMGNQQVLSSIDAIIKHIDTHAKAGDAIVIMSNGGFEGIHQRLLTVLRNKAT
jgi:UDP-N-acetylmuramate: L-alanyl-gamma-D-glutamyl-meso-diaminopimelate ligase